MYDIIGDIHGHSEKLDALLLKLGYTKQGKCWLPPDGRKAVFLGDLIDRGAGQLQVLETVRAMVDRGHAHCIMGNHELNAIAFATPDLNNSGEFVRKHSEKNIKDHADFMSQVASSHKSHMEWINWFRTLPLYLDLEGIRVVHACWNEGHFDTLAEYGLTEGYLDDGHIHWAFDKIGNHPVYVATEHIVKGPEIELPNGLTFTDFGHHDRTHARVRWWLPEARKLDEIAITTGHSSPDISQFSIPQGLEMAATEGPPIFIGHYWMSGNPAILSPNVACLDYSVGGGGPLVGYRWDGEKTLRNSAFVVA